MRKINLILLTKTLLTLLLYTATLAHAQQPDNFNYSTAVGLILYVEDGGHVFQRPDYDEPRNFFIIIYGIIEKYATQMKPQHAGLALDISSLPVEEKFLLVNNEAQKLLFLGDHWIGDGQQFSIMESGDYNRLKQLFAETRKHRGKPTEKATLDYYSQHIHKIWADDPEDFYREFYFPASNSTPNTVSSSTGLTDTKTASNIEIEKNDSRNETEVDTHAREKEPKKEQHTQEKQKEAVVEETTKSFAGNQLPDYSMQKQVPHNPTKPEKTTGTYSKLWLFTLLLILLSLIVYWRQRQMK
jgi:hypothetical protein